MAGDRDPGNRPLRQRNHRQEHGRSQEDVRILHRQGGLGGSVYTVDGSGPAYAKGILSGGGGGNDNSGGFFDPCELIFTDIGLANRAFPGTVAWY
ncbi:hypothetical protein [Streptomyces gardneri]|uniref:hypothetical protein n=1 Tax=Streptomyces gardneri TaxID=66892 RepID=UPI0035DE4512